MKITDEEIRGWRATLLDTLRNVEPDKAERESAIDMAITKLGNDPSIAPEKRVAWLAQTARNECLDARRRERTERERLGDRATYYETDDGAEVDPLEETASEGATPEQAAEARQLRAVLVEAIKALGPGREMEIVEAGQRLVAEGLELTAAAIVARVNVAPPPSLDVEATDSEAIAGLAAIGIQWTDALKNALDARTQDAHSSDQVELARAARKVREALENLEQLAQRQVAVAREAIAQGHLVEPEEMVSAVEMAWRPGEIKRQHLAALLAVEIAAGNGPAKMPGKLLRMRGEVLEGASAPLDFAHLARVGWLLGLRPSASETTPLGALGELAKTIGRAAARRPAMPTVAEAARYGLEPAELLAARLTGADPGLTALTKQDPTGKLVQEELERRKRSPSRK